MLFTPIIWIFTGFCHSGTETVSVVTPEPMRVILLSCLTTPIWIVPAISVNVAFGSLA